MNKLESVLKAMDGDIKKMSAQEAALLKKLKTYLKNAEVLRKCTM